MIEKLRILLWFMGREAMVLRLPSNE
jgi:hypothetical protein